ncbi:hypothetical protein [Nioella sp.]|uniref:hypothetical protein n=1 Tax=Nioella sp. TaxID=1912091 RepID=UPI0035165DB6
MPRVVDPAVQAYRETGRPMVERHLIWVSARLIADGTPVAGGFWTGRESAQLEVIDPVTEAVATRDYIAAGSLIEVEAIGQMSGLDIHPAQITLSPITPEVDTQLRAYELRGASVELHRLWFDYETRTPLAPAHVWMIGTINRAPLTTPAAGGRARLVYTIVPQTRQLTLGNPEVISDAVQSQRAGDRFLRHVALGGSREIPWMRHRVTGSGNGGRFGKDLGNLLGHNPLGPRR